MKNFHEFSVKPIEEPGKLPPVPTFRSKPNFKKEEAIASELFRFSNRLIRQYYYRTLKEIKELIQQLPEEADRRVYERCRKAEKDNEESIYDFFSPQVRFHLICWYDLKYYIHYTIGESPLKEAITKKIQYGIDSEFNMKYRPVQPDFNSFYQKVLVVQKDHIKLLPFSRSNY